LSAAEPVPILPVMTQADSAADLIDVSVNGEPRSLPARLTVAQLLERIGLDVRKVAVERNESIVPRSLYAQTWLAAGDALEIVHFIGGG
jgi:sulfur carrier protein